jgi:hypothetical protein
MVAAAATGNQTPAPAQPTPAPTTQPAPAAPGKEAFATKFEKDKSFYQKLTTKVEQTLKVQGGGADVPLKHEQTYYFKWTPVTVDKDKTVAKQVIEGLKFKMDIAGQTVDYDSTDPNPSGAAGNPGLTEFFKTLVGAEFTVTFGKNGAVEKVDGKEDILKKLAGVNPQVEGILRQVMSDETLKEMTDPAAGVTPPEPKGPNDTWEKKGTLSLGAVGSFDRTYVYTYKGKDAEKKELDRVEVKPTISYKPSTTPGGGLPFQIKSGKLDTKEVKQGVILYDPKAGRVESVRMNVILNGQLTVTVAGTDATVDLYQDQKTELDSADASLLPKKQ